MDVVAWDSPCHVVCLFIMKDGACGAPKTHEDCCVVLGTILGKAGLERWMVTGPQTRRSVGVDIPRIVVINTACRDEAKTHNMSIATRRRRRRGRTAVDGDAWSARVPRVQTVTVAVSRAGLGW